MANLKLRDFTKPFTISENTQEVLDFVRQNSKMVMATYATEFQSRYPDIDLASLKQRVHDARYRGFLIKSSTGVYSISKKFEEAQEKGLVTIRKTTRTYTKKNVPKKEVQTELQLDTSAANNALDSVAQLIRDNQNMNDAISKIEQILSELKVKSETN